MTNALIVDDADIRMVGAAEALAPHVDLADQLQACARSMSTTISQPGAAPQSEDDFLRGYLRALQDVADHLRHGDHLPGGFFDVHVGASA